MTQILAQDPYFWTPPSQLSKLNVAGVACMVCIEHIQCMAYTVCIVYTLYMIYNLYIVCEQYAIDILCMTHVPCEHLVFRRI